MSTVEQLGGAELTVLSPEETHAFFDRNEIVLIDVRTPNEYLIDHIPGALLLPLPVFDPHKLPGQEAKRFVLHCGAGPRARKAAEKCAAAGWTHLAVMEGGMAGWKKAGLPHVTVDMATGNFVTKP